MASGIHYCIPGFTPEVVGRITGSLAASALVAAQHYGVDRRGSAVAVRGLAAYEYAQGNLDLMKLSKRIVASAFIGVSNLLSLPFAYISYLHYLNKFMEPTSACIKHATTAISPMAILYK